MKYGLHLTNITNYNCKGCLNNLQPKGVDKNEPF